MTEFSFSTLKLLLHCVFTCVISKEKICRFPNFIILYITEPSLPAPLTHPPATALKIFSFSLFSSNLIMMCLGIGSSRFLCLEFIEILDLLVYSVENLGPLLLQIFFLPSQAYLWGLQLHLYQSSYISCPTAH